MQMVVQGKWGRHELVRQSCASGGHEALGTDQELHGTLARANGDHDARIGGSAARPPLTNSSYAISNPQSRTGCQSADIAAQWGVQFASI